VFGSTPPTKFMRDRVAKDVIAREAIPKLLELFRQCEDLEDAHGLGHIFTIFKGACLSLAGRAASSIGWGLGMFAALGHVCSIDQWHGLHGSAGMFTLGESVVTDALCKPDTLLDVIGMPGGGGGWWCTRRM
jgi:hypothetical protein